MSPSSPTSVTPALIIGSAIGGAIVLLVAVLLVFLLRRRRVLRVPLRGSDRGTVTEANLEFSGYNRMHESPVGGDSLHKQAGTDIQSVYEHQVGAANAAQSTPQFRIVRKNPSGRSSTAKAVLSTCENEMPMADGLGTVMLQNPLRTERSIKSVH